MYVIFYIQIITKCSREGSKLVDGMWQPSSSFVLTKSPSIIHKNSFV
jgi:hypothetical protein